MNALKNALHWRNWIIFAGLFLLSACDASASPVNPLRFQADLFRPHVQEQNWGQCEFAIDRAEVIWRERANERPRLEVEGRLPAHCQDIQLRINTSNWENTISVRMEAVPGKDAENAETRTLKSFFVSVFLRELVSGEYTLWINGVEIGQFKVL